jgi:octaprenyl-diphosphate synthase
MQGVLDVPTQVVPVAALLTRQLARVEEVFDRQLASDLPPVVNLVKHVENYRGKMLRPSLVIAVGLATHPKIAPTPIDEYERLIGHDHLVMAAVVEMVHMATLVHDDVLDDAETRRRGLTVNKLHGNEAAVILGDYLIASAYHLCSTLSTNDAAIAVGRASMVTCAGELLQLHHREDFSLDEPTYYEIVARKTAELIATAAELGCVASGADAATRLALGRFGRCLGVAFQVQDDILDLTGSETTVGKSTQKDMEKGKMTLPVIHHLAHASARQRGRTLHLLEEASGDQLHAAQRELVEVLRQTDSFNAARAGAATFINHAKRELQLLPDTPARALLHIMADTVLTRAF